MEYSEILKEAEAMENELIENYKRLHGFPGTGFDIEETYNYIKNSLEKMGYSPKRCGKSGIIVDIGDEGTEKVLLRADVDGLKIKEEADISFASKNGNMHACGHDMHATMLLGAARILKDKKLEGGIRLMFQPAEEILAGAKDMIEDGVLENVKSGIMLHVLPALPFECGTVIVSSPGISAPSADYFSINIEGVGGHGAMPEKCVSPILIAADMIKEIEKIDATVTVGVLQSGQVHNIIPDSGVIRGTMRTFDEEKRKAVKERIADIVVASSEKYGGKAELTFDRECPTLMNDEKISCHIEKTMIKLLGDNKVYTSEELSKNKADKSSGSEDFAYISHRIPALMVGMAAGKPEDGYSYNLHNPKVKFDMETLKYGVAVYVASAISLLRNGD